MVKDIERFDGGGEALTMVSRYESYAWRIKMGRLSSELGLSIRTLPQVLSWFGRVRIRQYCGFV